MMEQTLLVIRPLDPDASITIEGPPVPFGEGVFDDTDFVATGLEMPLYFGDGRGGSFISTSADDPADTPFQPRLRSGYQFNTAAFNGPRPTGAAAQSTGAIEIQAGDGQLDTAIDYAWDGRSAEIYRVTTGSAFSTATLCLRGTVESFQWSENLITLGLRNKQTLFNRPLLTGIYGGTGDEDGDSEITGVFKPQGYGQITNAEGITISRGLLIIQLHDREIESVSAVRDKGVALTFAADYADYDALAAATVAASHYATCLALGMIRLGSTPVGRVTVDFEGDAFGGYVSTAADIVRRIVTTRLGGGNIADPAEIDTAAFAALNVAQPAPLQFYSAGQNPQIADVLAQIMATVGGWYVVTRAGLLSVGRLVAPTSPTFTLDRTNISASERFSAQRLLPSWRERVEWGRPWVIQSGDDLAGSVSASDRDRWGRTHFSQASDTSIRNQHKLADAVETTALFAEEADAQTEATRLLALWGTPRDLISVKPDGEIFDRWIGDVGSLALTSADGSYRAGLPKNAVVIGIFENARTQETKLTMIG